MDIGIAGWLLAGLMLFMVARGIPAAINMVKHAPKGTLPEWLNAALLLAAVMAFVLFLMSIT